MLLQQVFAHFKIDKENDVRSPAEEWKLRFDDQALSHFWWPTEEENEAYWKRWYATPVEKRWNDPTFFSHPWDFESMIDAIYDAEYFLISCEKISESKGRLEYTWLYGSVEALEALVEAFECKVTEAEREEAWQEIEQELRQFENPSGFEGPCELVIGVGSK